MNLIALNRIEMGPGQVILTGAPFAVDDPEGETLIVAGAARIADPEISDESSPLEGEADSTPGSSGLDSENGIGGIGGEGSDKDGQAQGAAPTSSAVLFEDLTEEGGSRTAPTKAGKAKTK